jgi:hypothetical protein
MLGDLVGRPAPQETNRVFVVLRIVTGPAELDQHRPDRFGELGGRMFVVGQDDGRSDQGR